MWIYSLNWDTKVAAVFVARPPNVEVWHKAFFLVGPGAWPKIPTTLSADTKVAAVSCFFFATTYLLEPVTYILYLS